MRWQHHWASYNASRWKARWKPQYGSDPGLGDLRIYGAAGGFLQNR